MTTSFSTYDSAKATNVILHAFDWPYSRITENAEDIAKAGYKAVLVSPPLKSLKSENGTKWWQRYQPQDYRVIDNQLGNTTEFKQMTASLNQYGLLVYADIVFNHMANESDLRSDLSYPNSQVLQEYKKNKEYFESNKLFGDLSQPLFLEQDFVQAFPIKDWKDPWEVQHGRISGGNEDPGLPTLKYNKNVVKTQKSYLKALKCLGINGFRIDAAKHMSLDHILQVWDEEITDDTHIFGEIITDGGASKEEYELFLKPYLKSTTLGAYDFPLFHSIFNVFEKGESMSGLINPYSVGQALAYDRAITFAITHDIPNNDVFIDQVMTEQNERLAYCYLFGRDGGVPLVYSDLNTSGICSENGSPRWFDSWKDPMLINMVKFHNHFHGQPMSYLEHSDSHLVFSRGEQGFVVINKGATEKNVELPLGEYTELLGMKGVKLTKSTSAIPASQSNNKKEVKGEYVIATLPAMSCAMFITPA